MESFITFLSAVFVAILVAPALSNYLKIPLIVTEMLLGIILGNLLFNASIDDFSELLDLFKLFGLIYLMFLAGMEVDFERIDAGVRRTAFVSLSSLLIPFLTGCLLGAEIGVSPLFMGTLLSTTSLGVILPLTKEISDEAFKKTLLSSVVIVDILSMFLLAVSVTFIEGEMGFSFFYSLIFIVVLLYLPRILKKSGLVRFLDAWIDEESHFELGVRFSFALIIFLVALSESLGFHSIVGAFIAGLIISEALPHDKTMLERKLESFGYGFFIPILFILVGAKVDLVELFSKVENLALLFFVISVGIIAKVAGAGISSLLLGMSRRRALSFGILHSARLSLVIAAVEIGIQTGIIDEGVYAIFVVFAIISSIVAPSIGKRILES